MPGAGGESTQNRPGLLRNVSGFIVIPHEGADRVERVEPKKSDELDFVPERFPQKMGAPVAGNPFFGDARKDLPLE